MTHDASFDWDWLWCASHGARAAQPSQNRLGRNVTACAMGIRTPPSTQPLLMAKHMTAGIFSGSSCMSSPGCLSNTFRHPQLAEDSANGIFDLFTTRRTCSRMQILGIMFIYPATVRIVELDSSSTHHTVIGRWCLRWFRAFSCLLITLGSGCLLSLCCKDSAELLQGMSSHGIPLTF